MSREENAPLPSFEVQLAKLVQVGAITEKEAVDIRIAAERDKQISNAILAENMAAILQNPLYKDANASAIVKYFEDQIADLRLQVGQDPKTKLLNLQRFTEQLETFLGLEHQGRWCAVGLVDLTEFKWYNDELGHDVGDRILYRVASILQEQIRPADLLAHPEQTKESDQTLEEDRRQWLRARFGGDEFCFLVPDIDRCQEVHSVAERFREGVASYEWTQEDPGLAAQPVRVDVGVVCFFLGPVSNRRSITQRLATNLIQQADKLMYAAKGEKAERIHSRRLKIENGELVEVPDHISDDEVS